jgi:SAM-dependent methyltransferase
MNHVRPKATWPLGLPETDPERVRALYAEAELIGKESPYGWGHSLNFGPYQLEGLLGDGFLTIAGLLDAWAWWPEDMAGMTVADVGCFSGGLTVFLSSRRAARVLAVDEIAPHLNQCRFVKRAFRLENVECLEVSAYNLRNHVASLSLDFILLGGVLYHMSDMLVGLVAMQELLKPGGALVIESNAVDCFNHSYANFGRFAQGMWWQPTAKCIQEMCEFAGLGQPEIRFYSPNRCLVRCTKPERTHINFRRGMNWHFDGVLDFAVRSMDTGTMSPADCSDLK